MSLNSLEPDRGVKIFYYLVQFNQTTFSMINAPIVIKYLLINDVFASL